MWRCSSRKGVVHEPASPSHDRGHADSQPVTAARNVPMSGRLSSSPAIFANHRIYLGPAEIRAYLIHLAQDKCLAASSIMVDGLRAAVLLHRHPQTAVGRRGRYPHRPEGEESFRSC